jgi:hypothetical protein
MEYEQLNKASYIADLNDYEDFDYIPVFYLKSGKILLMFAFQDYSPYKYIGFELTEENFEKLLDNEVTLHDIYAYAQNCQYFVFETVNFEGFSVSQIVDIPEDYYPDKGVYLGLSEDKYSDIKSILKRFKEQN